MRPQFVPLILVSLFLLLVVNAFERGDHDLFRLKEDVEASWGKGVTFFDVLDIPATATVQEISKALRKKSVALHPDKAKHNFIASRSTPKPKNSDGKKSDGKKKKGTHVSKGPSDRELQRFMKEAAERYSQLGVIAEILKNQQSRERYQHFLKFGFPKWTITGWSYSRWRPGLGTVLVGLFICVGGFAHYFALTITYKNQVKLLESYRKYARKAAWGDDSPLGSIPGIATPTEIAPTSDEPDPLANLNRKQRREYERQTKKETKTSSNSKSTKSAPPPTTIPSPDGQRRRVTAENGKVFVVDSLGDVYLEEEDEDGNVNEFLLDPTEIPKPSMWNTAVVRLPIYLYRRVADPFLKDTKPIVEAEGKNEPFELDAAQEQVSSVVSATKAAMNDMSSSQMSDSGFEIVDSAGLEKEIGSAGQDADTLGMKKRSKKAKK